MFNYPHYRSVIEQTDYAISQLEYENAHGDLLFHIDIYRNHYIYAQLGLAGDD
jgi:hypothetical protein